MVANPKEMLETLASGEETESKGTKRKKLSLKKGVTRKPRVRTKKTREPEGFVEEAPVQPAPQQEPVASGNLHKRLTIVPNVEYVRLQDPKQKPSQKLEGALVSQATSDARVLRDVLAHPKLKQAEAETVPQADDAPMPEQQRPPASRFDLAAAMDEADPEKTDVIRPKGSDLRQMVGIQYGGLARPAASEQALENQMDVAEAKLDRAGEHLADAQADHQLKKEMVEQAERASAALDNAESKVDALEEKLKKIVAPAPKEVVDKKKVPVLTDAVEPAVEKKTPPSESVPAPAPKAKTPKRTETVPAPEPKPSETRQSPESFETADGVYTYGADGALMRRVKETGKEFKGGYVLFADFEKSAASAKRDFQASLEQDSDKRLYSVELVQAGESGKRFQPITDLSQVTAPDKLYFALVGRGVGVLPDSLVPAKRLPETGLTPITLRFFEENGKQMGERHIGEGPVTRVHHAEGSAGAIDELRKDMEAKRAEWIRFDDKTKEARAKIKKLLGIDQEDQDAKVAKAAYDAAMRKFAQAKQTFEGRPVTDLGAANEVLRTSRPMAEKPEAMDLLLKRFEKAEVYVKQEMGVVEQSTLFQKLNKLKKKTILALVAVFSLGTPAFVSKRPDDQWPEPQSVERTASVPDQELDAGGRYRGHSLRSQKAPIADQPTGTFTGDIATKTAPEETPLFPLSAQVSVSPAVEKSPVETGMPAVEATEEETEARAEPVVLELESGDNYIQSVIELLQSREDLKDDYDAETLKDMANHMVIDFAAHTGRSIVDLSNALPGSTITVDLEHMTITDIQHKQAGTPTAVVPPVTAETQATASFDTSFTASKPAAETRAAEAVPKAPKAEKTTAPDTTQSAATERPAPAAPTSETAGTQDPSVARAFQSMIDIITNQGHDRAAFDFFRSIVNEGRDISPDGLDKLMIVLGKQRDARERDLRKQGYTEEQIENDETFRMLLVQQNVISRFNRFVESAEYVMGVKMSRLDSQLKIDDIMLNVLKAAAAQGKLEKLEEYYQSGVVSNL